MICPICNKNMNYIMHFETNKRNGFYQCSNCYFKTHIKRLHLDEINKNDMTNQNNIERDDKNK